MALARKIEKSAFDAFTGETAWMKNAYKVDPSDNTKYILDADDGEGTTQALQAKQHEVDQHNATKGKLTEAEAERDRLKGEKEALETEKRAGWKKDPDRDAIENDLKAKLDKANKDKEDLQSSSNKRLTDYIVKNEADKLAEAMSTMPTMLSRELQERITVDLTGDKPTVRVLDKDGKPSASSLADLRKEIVDNPSYKPILKASDASGGGAGPGGGGGSAGAKAFKDMSETERTKLFNTNPAEFERLNRDHQAASAGYRV